MSCNIKIKKDEQAFIPKRSTDGAAGYDLIIPSDTVIPVGRSVIPLGVRMEIPNGMFGKIEPRSGFDSKGVLGVDIETKEKKRFDCDFKTGVIDEDYRGEICAIVKNNEKAPFIIERGTKVAQLIIHKYETVDFDVVSELTDTKRGEKGFGSTGAK